MAKTRPGKEVNYIDGTNGYFRFLFLIILLLSGIVGGKSSIPATDSELEVLLKKLNKPAVKTILSEGDIIDCVDIYKQPTFDHPLLKNHTIQMRPSFVPEATENKSFSEAFSEAFSKQIWQKDGNCPQGTIPIRRILKSDLQREGFLSSIGLNGEPMNCKVETSGARADRQQPYYGVGARINVWNLLVVTSEWSISTVAAVDGNSFVESGWGVSPILFGDSQPRFLNNWRVGDRGCYNLWCPGFVQVSAKYYLGCPIHPLSAYEGKQYIIFIRIYKDDVQDKWWLVVRDEPIGYWPQSIFPNLKAASEVQWLGKVCNTEQRGYHTVTQMGSGHWPREGFGKASCFVDMLVLFKEPTMRSPRRYDYGSSTNGRCYDVDDFRRADGRSFFYGGPGGPCCDGRCNRTAAPAIAP